jgi:DNA adenine methylase
MYKNKKTFDLNDHKRLYLALKGVKGKFLLSYNDCEFVRELYKDFKIVESDAIQYTLGANVHKNKKVVRELFIMNY